MSFLNTSQKFLLVSIIPQTLSDADALIELQELKSLVESYGGRVVDLVYQRREVHDKGSYIGSGKIQEAAGLIVEKQVDIVVLNGIVKPGQLFDMKVSFQKANPDIEVWDRVDLILEIFAKHANTAEAKLQIELAAMRHMGPRIYGMGMVLSQQSGGIGTRGIGETNTELMKRHWREQMKRSEDKLQKLAKDRERQLERRRRVGLKTVSIVGYTNAGKTSLFNALSGKKKFAKDVLFATLDSHVSKIYLPRLKKEILVSDTIGFIQNLPAGLIEAFKSTLMESMHAELLLHVIDMSDSTMHKKIAVVKNILYELGIGNKKQMYVFNKLDRADKKTIDKIQEEYARFTPQFISVKDGKGITDLLYEIERELMTQPRSKIIHVA